MSADYLKHNSTDEVPSPSKFRQNVKRFLEKQREIKATATNSKGTIDNTTETELGLQSKDVRKSRTEDKDSLKHQEQTTVDLENEIVTKVVFKDVSKHSQKTDNRLLNEDKLAVPHSKYNDINTLELEENIDGVDGNDSIELEISLAESDNDEFMGKDLDNDENNSVKNLENKSNVKNNDAVNLFEEDTSKIKNLANPDESRMSAREFDKEIYFAFKRALPWKILKDLTSRYCKLCQDEFHSLGSAWRHYRGYNHRRTVKCFIKGTYKGHPPFFKMCLSAVMAYKDDGAKEDQIVKYIEKKFSLKHENKKIKQLMLWGIERLMDNKYVHKREERFFLTESDLAEELMSGVDIRLPSLEMSSSSKTKSIGSNNAQFSIAEFERKLKETYKERLPYRIIKSFKPNFCGLCHVDIRNTTDPWTSHYSTKDHEYVVSKFKFYEEREENSRPPSYMAMVDEFMRRERPRVMSEEMATDYIIKNYGLREEREIIRQGVQRAIASLLLQKNGESRRRPRTPSPVRRRISDSRMLGPRIPLIGDRVRTPSPVRRRISDLKMFGPRTPPPRPRTPSPIRRRISDFKMFGPRTPPPRLMSPARRTRRSEEVYNRTRLDQDKVRPGHGRALADVLDNKRERSREELGRSGGSKRTKYEHSDKSRVDDGQKSRNKEAEPSISSLSIKDERKENTYIKRNKSGSRHSSDKGLKKNCTPDTSKKTSPTSRNTNVVNSQPVVYVSSIDGKTALQPLVIQKANEKDLKYNLQLVQN